METLALYFNIIVQFAGVLYLSFAFVLCLYKTPKREIYKTYRRSQRFLALNYLVMGMVLCQTGRLVADARPYS